MALNVKQKRFCDEYLIDLNATQAAIRAGYSAKTANQIGFANLSRPEIKEFIDSRMAEKESELIADQNEILRYLTSVMRGQSSSSVLARNELGADVEKQKAPDEKERLKAAELLGKRYGIYTDKVSMEVKPVIIDGGDDLED